MPPRHAAVCIVIGFKKYSEVILGEKSVAFLLVVVGDGGEAHAVGLELGFGAGVEAHAGIREREVREACNLDSVDEDHKESTLLHQGHFPYFFILEKRRQRGGIIVCAVGGGIVGQVFGKPYILLCRGLSAYRFPSWPRPVPLSRTCREYSSFCRM